MSLNRYAVRRDTAEPPIIAALEQVGAEVWVMDGPCDLLVRFRKVWHLLEVKTGRGKKGTVSKDRRQAKQQAFIASTGTPIVRTPIEALKAIGAIEMLQPISTHPSEHGRNTQQQRDPQDTADRRGVRFIADSRNARPQRGQAIPREHAGHAAQEQPAGDGNGPVLEPHRPTVHEEMA